MHRSLLRATKKLLLLLCILAVLLEAASLVYIHAFNPNVPLPTYSFVNSSSKFWVDVDEHFGVWHMPHSSYLHNKACFTVRYSANALGMRDPERSLQSNATRVAVLGDSFIEGWGNRLEDRLTNRLEAATGHEFLNFGTSGGFGTIQEWLQYKHLVSRFRHDVVLLAVLPVNDFSDNDYRYAIKTGEDDYRPYLLGSYPDYRLTYLRPIRHVNSALHNLLKSFDFTLREWSAFYRVVRYLTSFRLHGLKLVPRWEDEVEVSSNKVRCSYYDYTRADLDILRYCLEQIGKECKGKPLIVFTIPTQAAFLRPESAPAPLALALADLARKQGFTYVDLLEKMKAKGITAEDVFFVCDNHWNAFGNEVAAGILLPYVNEALQKAERKP